MSFHDDMKATIEKMSLINYANMQIYSVVTVLPCYYILKQYKICIKLKYYSHIFTCI